MKMVTSLARVTAVAVTIVLVSCTGHDNTTDGVIRHCLAGQSADPGAFGGGAVECECTANKLRGLLTADHYAVFAGFWGTATDIEAAHPGLRAPELSARVLKKLASERDQNPTELFQLLSASNEVTTYAYELCGVFPKS